MLYFTMEKEQKTIRRQVSKKMTEVNKLRKLVKGVSSWSVYIRGALGMSVTQLAARLKCSQSSVSELEKRERDGNITIQKLKDLAQAMECEFVYTFIPNKSIHEIVGLQAREKAIRQIESSDTHMALEDQLVKTEYQERLEDLTEEMLYSKYLWDLDE
jgi:predicted DNA-binding mobile mystery protein A